MKRNGNSGQGRVVVFNWHDRRGVVYSPVNDNSSLREAQGGTRAPMIAAPHRLHRPRHVGFYSCRR